MTLHGQTKKVTIPLQVQRNGNQIQLVGNYEFAWADFGMTAPSVGSFVSVTGNPKLEFTVKLSEQPHPPGNSVAGSMRYRASFNSFWGA